MELTELAIVYLVMTVSALIYLAAKMYTKLDRQRRIDARRQYQKRIDDLVQQLFPASDAKRREIKDKMVADIRTYFKQKREEERIERVWESVPNWKERKPS